MAKKEEKSMEELLKEETEKLVKAKMPDIFKHSKAIDAIALVQDMESHLNQHDDKDEFTYVHILFACHMVMQHIEHCLGRPIEDSESKGLLNVAFNLGRIRESNPELLKKINDELTKRFGTLDTSKIISALENGKPTIRVSGYEEEEGDDELMKMLRKAGANVKVIHIGKGGLGGIGSIEDLLRRSRPEH